MIYRLMRYNPLTGEHLGLVDDLYTFTDRKQAVRAMIELNDRAKYMSWGIKVVTAADC